MQGQIIKKLGFVSLFSTLNLKSPINKHMFSSLFSFESGSVRYSSSKNFLFLMGVYKHIRRQHSSYLI